MNEFAAICDRVGRRARRPPRHRLRSAHRDGVPVAVTKRGNALTVVSGPDADPEIRMTASDGYSWLLEVADHRGRWEATPFEGAALSIGRLEDI